MIMEPTGSDRPMVRRLRLASGHRPRRVEGNRRPIRKPGVSSMTAIMRSATPAISGAMGESRETSKAVPVSSTRGWRPRRGRRSPGVRSGWRSANWTATAPPME